MYTPETTIEQTHKPQITKEELELKKIELEIKDLERPFWKRPSYILAGLPTLLAIVTLSVGLFNGYFSASLIKLENQKDKLEAEIKAFQVTRAELYSENNLLKSENNLLKTDKEWLEVEKKTLEVKLAEIKQSYEAQLVALRNSWEELEKNNKSLSLTNTNLFQAKKDQETEIRARLKEIESLQAKLKAGSGQRNMEGAVPGPRCML